MKRIDEINRIDSCLNKAADNEPVFVLRANDPLAADLVRYWASKYMAFKFGENFDTTGKSGMTPAQRAKYNEARQLADEMDAWRKVQAEADAALKG